MKTFKEVNIRSCTELKDEKYVYIVDFYSESKEVRISGKAYLFNGHLASIEKLQSESPLYHVSSLEYNKYFNFKELEDKSFIIIKLDNERSVLCTTSSSFMNILFGLIKYKSLDEYVKRLNKYIRHLEGYYDDI